MKNIQRIAALLPAISIWSTSLAWAADETAVSEPNAQNPSVPLDPAVQSAPAVAVTNPAQPNSFSPPNAVTHDRPSALATRAEAGPTTPTEPKRVEAVPETVFGPNVKIGGFGGLGVMYTRFADRDVAQLCLEGALLLDRKLSIGAAGCGISPTLRTTKFDPAANPDYRTSFGYGGAVVRYQFASYKYFGFALSTLVGAGGIISGAWDKDRNDDDEWRDASKDFVFVVEPHLDAYVNVTQWLRVGATGGYRFVSGVETTGLRTSDVAAPTFGLLVQVGSF